MDIAGLTNAPAGLTSKKALGLGSDGLLYWFPIQDRSTVRITYVNGSRAILPQDIAGGGVLISTSPVPCILTLPTMWRLGVTDSNTQKVIFGVCREGLGKLIVTPAAYRGSVASQAAMLALSPVTPEDYCWRSDANGGVGQMFVLTQGLPNVLANWVAVPPNAANRPVIPTAPDTGVMVNWGVNGAFDPSTLPNDVTVALEGKSLDHWKAG